jgi:glycine dehydrogenase
MTPAPHDFVRRHIGPSPAAVRTMLDVLGVDTLEDLIEAVVPASVRTAPRLELGPALSEHDLLATLRAMAEQNGAFRSFQGTGYHETLTPPAILRNILEDPGWYTAYTPYQAEIAQGRLEMLLNWQTVVTDLTGLGVANASVLDEATGAAEAMGLCARLRPRGNDAHVFRVDSRCHPQTLAVVRTRAEALGFEIELGQHEDWSWSPAEEGRVFGCLVQSPDTRGLLHDITSLSQGAHAASAKVVVATDLLALTLITPPGEQGADVVVGSAQRLGVPMGWGGPHAGFFATREAFKRQTPGRIIGLSHDAQGAPGLRMALQTREQHIRRDRATSNICTAQVLLAVMAGAYALWHGPAGLTAIASHLRGLATSLAAALSGLGHAVEGGARFDTVTVRPVGRSVAEVLAAAVERGMNLRDYGDGTVGVSFGEPADAGDLNGIVACFGGVAEVVEAGEDLPQELVRTSAFMTHEVFHCHQSETELLRYLTRLRNKDLSLAHSMIPLGSCTMKLNAAAEMIPVTWPGFANPHPFAPADQVRGYQRLVDDLESKLATITGFDAISLQPNAGSQGEYAGLLVIREWHRSRGDDARRVCLIPTSAHGTNPASAVMADMRVVAVRCDDTGDIDLDDLRGKAAKHAAELGALMVTYPSTHGVFEEGIQEICEIVHAHGGQVYMDGANLNALVGVARPGDLGADVCHLNLHKTFCIPHGGGGPGMGPIGVKAHLAPFLPGHPMVEGGGEDAIGAISAAPYGSPSILPISWAYITMMGGDGLTRATAIAILSANYVARRLEPHFPVLYKGRSGFVAHECIIDLRPLKASSGITVDDVAKRLMDFGFHAPTMSWPVAGTMMIEPTESESLPELERFCEAMITIRQEISRVESGQWPRDDNPLVHAPHTASVVTADDWTHAYTRTEAAFPLGWVRERKFWPAVGRVDNAYGDRHLVCACPTVEELAEE